VSKYRAVFFDAGETLLSPHPSFHELFAGVLKEHGTTVDSEEVLGAFERVAPNFIEVLGKLGTTTWSTSREISRRFWGTVYDTAFSELGIEDQDDALKDALYGRFTKYESYRLFPDSVPAVEKIRAAGLTVGLISNFEEWLEGMLIHFEVAPLFDVMVISGKEGVEKPDPVIFLRALEKAGVEPEQAVYVGDHPIIDVEAAESIGMDAVLIDRRGRYPDFPGTRIDSLDEIHLIIAPTTGQRA